jgi:TnpA family transposase
MSGGDANENYKDLLYIRRRFLNGAARRNAIAQVANAIFQTRLTHIWGEATTACASDSKKFGAWDQNLSLHHATLIGRAQVREVRGKSIRGVGGGIF